MGRFWDAEWDGCRARWDGLMRGRRNGNPLTERVPNSPRDGWDGSKHPQRVIGYVRVSTEDQADNGISLEEQRTRIRAYATAHGLEVVRIAADEGISGKTIRSRPGLLSALEELSDAEADGLVVCKLDRLSRTTTDLLGLVEQANRGSNWIVAATDCPAENSELLPEGSVAVEVTTWPTLTATGKLAEKLTLPLPSVVTGVEPRNV